MRGCDGYLAGADEGGSNGGGSKSIAARVEQGRERERRRADAEVDEVRRRARVDGRRLSVSPNAEGGEEAARPVARRTRSPPRGDLGSRHASGRAGCHGLACWEVLRTAIGTAGRGETVAWGRLDMARRIDS